MSDDREIAKQVLLNAGRTILQDRPGVHGSAENSFDMIAELWTVYLRHNKRVRNHDQVFNYDVAEMMSMLKKARNVYGSTNPDNAIDDTGYTALGEMLRTDSNGKVVEVTGPVNKVHNGKRDLNSLLSEMENELNG